jgi:DNA-binding NarL/FixJ family response regulator
VKLREVAVDPYKIVLADDHTIFRQAVRRLLEQVPGLKIVGEAADGLELLQLLPRTSPRLVILDLSMPNYGGMAAVKEMQRLRPQVKVLILSMHKTRAHFYRAMSMQVQGYLLKEDTHEELLAAIKVIRRGGTYISTLLAARIPEIKANKGPGDLPFQENPLTDREMQILSLLAEGKTNQQIADLLAISIRTVETHRLNIKRKLDLRKSIELIKYAIHKGYTTMGPVDALEA